MPTEHVSSLAAPFEALIFDLGGVIVAHDNSVLDERIRSRCAAGMDPAAIRAIGSRDEFGTGEASIAALHQALIEEAGYQGDWETFSADWCCHLEIDPSMLAFVERLAHRNRVLLFSNTNDVHWDFLVAESAGRLAKFEAYLSHEIGQLKPSTAAFSHVARDAGIDPSRSIFFDDRLDNVEGARRAGFRAEVFTNEPDLRRMLLDEGVRLD
jgi:putative hydrolase of the HAD superfamily